MIRGFSGTATFGLGEPNQTELTAADRDDIFVAKYDRDGALLWARRAGGTGLDLGRGIATTSQALIALARRRINVLWAMLNSRRAFVVEPQLSAA